jgi:hypothetical protein
MTVGGEGINAERLAGTGVSSGDGLFRFAVMTSGVPVSLSTNVSAWL